MQRDDERTVLIVSKLIQLVWNWYCS